MPETNFRTLCEQLMELAEGKRYDGSAVIAKARAALAQPDPARQPTFAELLMPPPSTALAQPDPAAPTDEEIYNLALEGDFLVDVGDGFSCMIQDEVEFARAVLARWGSKPPSLKELALEQLREINEEMLAAALRVVADQVVPEQLKEPHGTGFRWGGWAAEQGVRNKLLAIAAELDGTNNTRIQ